MSLGIPENSYLKGSCCSVLLLLMGIGLEVQGGVWKP